MPEPPGRSLHVSIPDADLRRFARDRARLFFGGNASRYIAELVRLDREDDIIPDEIERRLAESVDEREAVAS